MYQIEEIRVNNVSERIAITRHAKLRLEERGIKVKDVERCIDTGEIIMQYEDDKPLPSCLILGKDVEGKGMHIVVSMDAEFIYLITSYYPDETQWEDDLKTRKGR